MGFTLKLALGFVALLILDGLAFARGRKRNKWGAFIALTTLFLVGLVTLWVLWILWPM